MKSAAAGLAILFTCSVAGANVEIGGTGGYHVFSKDNELGVAEAPDAASLKNAPIFGLRFGIYGTTIGLEVEGDVIPSKSRKAPADVIAGVGRGHLVLQFRAGTYENKLIPFILVGGGVMRVVKSSDTNVIAKDTDPLGYGGLGVKIRGKGWGVRLEGRFLIVPSSAKEGKGGIAYGAEALGSIYIEFGHKKKASTEQVPKVDDKPDDVRKPDVVVTPPKVEPTDKDKDGVIDTDDKCADQAEDKDGFQDEDGCPDPDNDDDGIADASDKCGDQPETKNGITDEDGCPDEIPANLKPFLRPIAGVSFKPNTAVFAGRSAKVLDKAVAAIAPLTEIKIEIQVHTDDVKPKGKLKTNEALSQARADAVKAYLVKKGLDAARLDAKGYAATQPIKDTKGLKGARLKAARAKNARVELTIIP